MFIAEKPPIIELGTSQPDEIVMKNTGGSVAKRVCITELSISDQLSFDTVYEDYSCTGFDLERQQEKTEQIPEGMGVEQLCLKRKKIDTDNHIFQLDRIDKFSTYLSRKPKSMKEQKSHCLFNITVTYQDLNNQKYEVSELFMLQYKNIDHQFR